MFFVVVCGLDERFSVQYVPMLNDTFAYLLDRNCVADSLGELRYTLFWLLLVEMTLG